MKPEEEAAEVVMEVVEVEVEAVDGAAEVVGAAEVGAVVEAGVGEAEVGAGVWAAMDTADMDTVTVDFMMEAFMVTLKPLFQLGEPGGVSHIGAAQEAAQEFVEKHLSLMVPLPFATLTPLAGLLLAITLIRPTDTTPLTDSSVMFKLKKSMIQQLLVKLVTTS